MSKQYQLFLNGLDYKVLRESLLAAFLGKTLFVTALQIDPPIFLPITAIHQYEKRRRQEENDVNVTQIPLLHLQNQSRNKKVGSNIKVFFLTYITPTVFLILY